MTLIINYVVQIMKTGSVTLFLFKKNKILIFSFAEINIIKKKEYKAEIYGDFGVEIYRGFIIVIYYIINFRNIFFFKN